VVRSQGRKRTTSVTSVWFRLCASRFSLIHIYLYIYIFIYSWYPLDIDSRPPRTSTPCIGLAQNRGLCCGYVAGLMHAHWCWHAWAGNPPMLKEVDTFSAESVTLPETPPTCCPWPHVGCTPCRASLSIMYIYVYLCVYMYINIFYIHPYVHPYNIRDAAVCRADTARRYSKLQAMEATNFLQTTLNKSQKCIYFGVCHAVLWGAYIKTYCIHQDVLYTSKRIACITTYWRHKAQKMVASCHSLPPWCLCSLPKPQAKRGHGILD